MALLVYSAALCYTPVMARYVFHPGELQAKPDAVFLKAPYPHDDDPVEVLELEPLEEAPAPLPSAGDAEDARLRRAELETELDVLRDAARREGAEILDNAKADAEAIKAQADAALEDAKSAAEKEAASIIENAKKEAAAITDSAEREKDARLKEAEAAGKDAGNEAGYEAGKEEAERLVQRLHTVLERVQDRRIQILDECEQQIVELSLLVSRKVVKILIQSDREEIIKANIAAALKKLRDKGLVTVRVNLEDLKLTSAHKAELIKSLENFDVNGSGVSLHIEEDSSVDAGGCIVETDFGEIDARIGSQLQEMENRILEITPLGKR